MKVFRNREEAEKAGLVIFGRHAFTKDGAKAGIIRSPLEARLAEVLEAVEWASVNDDACPVCDRYKQEGHAPDCKLWLALKAFHGEAS